MAIAGIFIGIMGTRDTKQLRGKDRLIVITSATSVILGVFTTINAMGWFDQQNNGIATARNFLAFQFALVYLPLFWYVLDVISGWLKKNKK